VDAWVNYRHECKTFDCVVITVINLHEADPGLDPASQHNIGVGDVLINHVLQVIKSRLVRTTGSLQTACCG